MGLAFAFLRLVIEIGVVGHEGLRGRMGFDWCGLWVVVGLMRRRGRVGFDWEVRVVSSSSRRAEWRIWACSSLKEPWIWLFAFLRLAVEIVLGQAVRV